LLNLSENAHLASLPIADHHVTCVHIMHAVPGLNKRLRVRWAVSWLVDGQKLCLVVGLIRPHLPLHLSTTSHSWLKYFHH